MHFRRAWYFAQDMHQINTWDDIFYVLVQQEFTDTTLYVLDDKWQQQHWLYLCILSISSAPIYNARDIDNATISQSCVAAWWDAPKLVKLGLSLILIRVYWSYARVNILTASCTRLLSAVHSAACFADPPAASTTLAYCVQVKSLHSYPQMSHDCWLNYYVTKNHSIICLAGTRGLTCTGSPSSVGSSRMPEQWSYVLPHPKTHHLHADWATSPPECTWPLTQQNEAFLLGSCLNRSHNFEV